jgi:hypothetical protein
MPAPATPPWSVRRRILVSALVTLHVSAIFVGAFSAPPTSALGEQARSVLRPYIEAADLNHGYRFFNIPGPSHLVKYQLEFRDGRLPLTGTFPNLKQHQPRLRYHRHFMLSESVEALSPVPPISPPGTRPGDEAYEEWRRAREELNRGGDALIASYAKHLLATHDAKKVTLWAIERGLPSMEQVREGLKLGDERFVMEVKLGEWEASQ